MADDAMAARTSAVPETEARGTGLARGLRPA